ncbi:hypothetical protein PHLGIDRAFT_222889 [Phlebiopsis gigantea 11061_1 CR5-6]|uniref:Uncharacterized protein n=1 Tax=Phlebiopsis gigantea (strain 11061_1 CR5-6) TaxID=745531 RepID=A0A0C3RT91_PHLG1|nr:hypothetical protein PHLGIDRAFT_222889 [Phlebiopsis gigantea 11061_1 CR5-6]
MNPPSLFTDAPCDVEPPQLPFRHGCVREQSRAWPLGLSPQPLRPLRRHTVRPRRPRTRPWESRIQWPATKLKPGGRLSRRVPSRVRTAFPLSALWAMPHRRAGCTPRCARNSATCAALPCAVPPMMSWLRLCAAPFWRTPESAGKHWFMIRTQTGQKLAESRFKIWRKWADRPVASRTRRGMIGGCHVTIRTSATPPSAISVRPMYKVTRR